MSSDDLRRIWQGHVFDLDDLFEREEALMTYWHRVATGAEPFAQSELELVYATGLHHVGSVVGELAMYGKLSTEEVERNPDLLAQLSDDEQWWGLAQLRATRTLGVLRSRDATAPRPSLEDLLAKGTSWAAIAAMPFLLPDERDTVVREADERKVFSRSQRHELREARARASKG